DFVVCADRDMAWLLRNARPAMRVEWLPHCVSGYEELLATVPRSRLPHPFVCWLPLTLPDRDPYYRHKNTYCQLAAVKLAVASTGLPIQVATNFVSDPLRRFAAGLGVPLRETGSMDRQTFCEFRGEIGLGLCASLSESFSYNAAELMLLGIPTLFGPAIEWAWRSAELVSLCGALHPGSTGSIARRIQHLLLNHDA